MIDGYSRKLLVTNALTTQADDKGVESADQASDHKMDDTALPDQV